MTVSLETGVVEGSARYPSLRDKVVFVTGGASGIGRSVVEHFHDQGSKVVFVDIAENAGFSLCDELERKAGHRPVFKRCDLKNVGDLQNVIEQVGRDVGPITVLVNNAGNDDRHKLEDVTSEYFDDRVAVNLKHQLFTAKAVRPQMKAAGGGSIINFSSITWTVADGDCVVYVTSKAAVVGLTRALSTELGGENIRVNAIAPGWVMTERQVSLWLNEDGERQIGERQALKGRLHSPDIARMCLWLGASDSCMVSKQTFVVDAGWI
ncbi:MULTISPECIES: SDR family NAD(P)-dependent oxidoreductase [unclassified Rhizobium]|uniref:SDR family NAD(P)-dependent oxidoreductase n=1 Tax=unclassified Rhizobium TaxID=2613769 RepID=UPI00177FF0DF|nr:MULTISPECIES: SDR family oxidoreductase [unclassified Rhizobium]MBD8688842.1 SDR family oxidoreductase [Rhizobium sp. CFBP 13644]MBD8694187.1 SDR family oxidoreductase [Rhizobium sp. CFBP 13717]